MAVPENRVGVPTARVVLLLSVASVSMCTRRGLLLGLPIMHPTPGEKATPIHLVLPFASKKISESQGQTQAKFVFVSLC